MLKICISKASHPFHDIKWKMSNSMAMKIRESKRAKITFCKFK